MLFDWVVNTYHSIRCNLELHLWFYFISIPLQLFVIKCPSAMVFILRVDIPVRSTRVSFHPEFTSENINKNIYVYFAYHKFVKKVVI